ncbi:hypothetical protein [Halarchaeum sp. P4]|uniref:hypothetical protein n=1 Tax=Halarchaeum sp. P4 TaxID=3421639 RepID=UPI003EC0A3B3
MTETESRDLEFTGREADVVREALERHEPKAPDVETETIDDIEAAFDHDVTADATVAVSLTRARARIAIAALEEREVRTRGIERERALELRERLAEEFGFERRDVSGPEGEVPTAYPPSQPGV